MQPSPSAASRVVTPLVMYRSRRLGKENSGSVTRHANSSLRKHFRTKTTRINKNLLSGLNKTTKMKNKENLRHFMTQPQRPIDSTRESLGKFHDFLRVKVGSLSVNTKKGVGGKHKM